LDIGDTQLRELRPLAGLRKLEWLSLGEAPINDLAPLVGVTNLTDLAGISHVGWVKIA
jgi:internalin A